MILIIGAGLSGLLTAYRLKKEGIPFKILEARNRVGGRIHTIYNTNEAPVEMGATWFTGQHSNIIKLLAELDIEYFEQYMDSTVFYQDSNKTPVKTVQIPPQSTSYRIAGGTSTLITRLLSKLDTNDVMLNQPVRGITFKDTGIQVHANTTFECDQVVVASPPKLWVNKILFEPTLPKAIAQVARKTHTWMEDSIKVAITYNEPFWEQENMSRTLFSSIGPITEFYDHYNKTETAYALCGFINSGFKKLSDQDRRARVLAQLENIFGTRALSFLSYTECLWSNEVHTHDDTGGFLFPHQNNGNPIFSTPLFENKLFIASSETALEFPGYMDGAVYSGNETARKILDIL